jgi:acetyltransferase-like isoleucine patch superfamily enzyme
MILGSSDSVLGKLRVEFREAVSRVDPRRMALGTCAGMLPAFSFPRLRTVLYRMTGSDIGEECAFLGKVTVVGPPGCESRLRIGAQTLVGPGVTFGLDAPISIGRGVSIGPGVTLYTATHALGPGSQRMSRVVEPRRVIVEDGVWIGMHALILPGVRLGQGSVISAGAVVLEDVPPNSLVAGNPAQTVRELPLGNR